MNTLLHLIKQNNNFTPAMIIYATVICVVLLVVARATAGKAVLYSGSIIATAAVSIFFGFKTGIF